MIKAAIPFFIFFIALEWFISRKKGFEWYKGRDVFANVSCGILSQLIGFVLKGAGFLVYVWLYQKTQDYHLISSPWIAWTVGFIGVDFFYYWYHRVSHETNLFWSFHVVHHQSEEYNLSVAVRQTGLGGLVSWIFYLPLALIGISFEVMITCYALNLIYQFFIHTRWTKSFGFLDYIFNTPSHHRVHHGRNEKYLDRNYAGVFIVWDLMFKTFEPEVEDVDYGTVVPFHSANPVWANISPLRDLGLKVAEAKSLRVLLQAPGR